MNATALAALARLSPEARKAIAARLEISLAKAEQSRYGCYDKHGVRQGGLMAFIRYFWSVLEPATRFVDGWPLWAMAEHLEAITRGDINRLLINVPPGFQKSMMVNIWWPAWEWGPMNRPHERYLAFSYSASLTIRDNRRFRDLLCSDEYRKLYGDHVKLRNDAVNLVLNEATGWKIASSVGGSATGHRSSRILLDDPHSVAEAESEAVRGEAVRWFRESMSNRLQDLDKDAIGTIMQRVHEDDVSGVILAEDLGYTTLMVPMTYDSNRQTSGESTEIDWVDPRHRDDPDECDGALAWPARFSPEACEKMKRQLGPYGWAAQYEQAPAPRGGGIFKVDWWQVWQAPDNKMPHFDYIIASLDGAFTEDEENDPSALTVWGTFLDKNRRRRIMLIDAWRKHLKFSGPRVDRLEVPTIIDGRMWPAEIVTPGLHHTIVAERNRCYRRRCMETWGLIEHVADTCRHWKVSTLLVEAAGPGLAAATELCNRHAGEGWSVNLIPVKGDKVARAYAAVPVFSQMMVYAPLDRNGQEFGWARMVIDEMATFPKGRFDDLTDSTTQAINYLRRLGYAQSDDEIGAAETSAATPRPKLRPLYNV
jgi:predicted phage terminase large subunit-like protein